MVVDKPYSEETTGNNQVIRRFDDINEESLIWHRDKEDRIINLIEGTQWKLQMENQLPTTIEKDIEIFIPKNTYHRIIKGKDNLVIKITKQL
jgi:quercetin dioxygenase-like cupin family protein